MFQDPIDKPMKISQPTLSEIHLKQPFHRLGKFKGYKYILGTKKWEVVTTSNLPQG